MTITEVRLKCKSITALIPRDVLLLGILLFASTCAFGLGYLAGVDEGSVSETAPQTASLEPASASAAGIGEVVASKYGTKYYLPECAGANRISAGNKVSFPSVVAAEKAGYTAAANCQGL